MTTLVILLVLGVFVTYLVIDRKSLRNIAVLLGALLVIIVVLILKFMNS